MYYFVYYVYALKLILTMIRPNEFHYHNQFPKDSCKDFQDFIIDCF